MVGMNKLPGEGTIAPPAGLSLEEEAFLFGHHGPLDVTDKVASTEIFLQKEELAYIWLAQFWSLPVPEEFIAADEAAQVEAQEFIDTGIFGDTTPLPPNPVATALRLEADAQSGSLDERPILQTTLFDAYNALESDPSRNAKLGYVIALLDEEYKVSLTDSMKEAYRYYEFPQPVPEYDKQLLPAISEKSSGIDVVSVGADDFRAYRQSPGPVTRAWNGLKRLASSQPDFPLRFDATDPKNEQFIGDLEVAVAWLEGHKPYNKHAYTQILRETLASHQQLAELRKTQPAPYAMREADLTDDVWRDIVGIYHEVAYGHTFEERDIAMYAAAGSRDEAGFIKSDEFRYGSRYSMHSKLLLTTPERGLLAFRFHDNLSPGEMWNPGPIKRGVEFMELTLKKRVAEYLKTNGLIQALGSDH